MDERVMPPLLGGDNIPSTAPSAQTYSLFRGVLPIGSCWYICQNRQMGRWGNTTYQHFTDSKPRFWDSITKLFKKKKKSEQTCWLWNPNFMWFPLHHCLSLGPLHFPSIFCSLQSQLYLSESYINDRRWPPVVTETMGSFLNSLKTHVPGEAGGGLNSLGWGLQTFGKEPYENFRLWRLRGKIKDVT